MEEIASGGELSRVMLALKTTIEAGQARRSGAPLPWLGAVENANLPTVEAPGFSPAITGAKTRGASAPAKRHEPGLRPGRNGGSGNAAQRTLVFDEIDSGIGGRAAEAVGKKLKQLSRTKQVLCVTHLPQIASFADHHYLIEKRESAGRTKTSVHLLDAEERTREIARMISGAKLTDTSLKHAEQMLKANR